MKHFDFAIVGGGCIGLSIAMELKRLNESSRIVIIDSEYKLGIHSSGRNSGVLHAGIYYEPGSLKAKVCTQGAKELKDWVKKKNLKINTCGKIILAQKSELDSQLDLLYERGQQNGANVQFITRNEIQGYVPEATSAAKRGIWSPNTAVVEPLKVIEAMVEELKEKNVAFMYGCKENIFEPSSNRIKLQTGETICYQHLFNTAGIAALKVAKQFEVGNEFSVMPFKGIYWKLNSKSTINIRTNLYPVPDLNVPFLGIHFTPNADTSLSPSIGPTATLALGKNNYLGLEGFEPVNTIKNLALLTRQYIEDSNGFRKYMHEQALLGIRPLMLREARRLIPAIKDKDIVPSNKRGIRAQLFDKSKNCLVKDFVCKTENHCTHVLNAISPAFTASFALARVIIDQARID